MIAEILECPFRLSIMSVDVQPQRSTAALEKAAAARTEAIEREQREEKTAENAQAMETAQNGQIEEKAEADGRSEELASGERDMTIGELYDMHRELSELEETVKAGEPIEEIQNELQKPKGILRGGLFLRRKQNKDASAAEVKAEEEKIPAGSTEAENTEIQEAEEAVQNTAEPAAESHTEPREKDDFEPVIPHNDVEEDTAAGEVNPYTGREYQSNSVRMHPTRIGYVQVYDRTIHKWTDMTEWAFLGLQERKKALLGKAYEPPIYLD